MLTRLRWLSLISLILIALAACQNPPTPTPTEAEQVRQVVQAMLDAYVAGGDLSTQMTILERGTRVDYVVNHLRDYMQDDLGPLQAARAGDVKASREGYWVTVIFLLERGEVTDELHVIPDLDDPNRWMMIAYGTRDKRYWHARAPTPTAGPSGS